MAMDRGHGILDTLDTLEHSGGSDWSTIQVDLREVSDISFLSQSLIAPFAEQIIRTGARRDGTPSNCAGRVAVAWGFAWKLVSVGLDLVSCLLGRLSCRVCRNGYGCLRQGREAGRRRLGGAGDG